ncbi:MAG TPA: FtsX-like permease family protein [Ramlibacter sp.]|nr:FtsX-like permease family protein [Ramlibacter sp.]
MNLLGLSLRYLLSRPLAALLNLLLLTLGLATVSFVLLASAQLERAFERDLAGIDVVVGAKGSPIQLILAGVFHIDVPPGNVPLAEVQALERNPQVAKLIPLSLGDSFGGWRIVGTTPAWLSHYRLAPAQGRVWQQPMEAVLGATAARESGLAPGARFIGNHGLGGGGHAHGDTPFQVVGVLPPCRCVADRLVLTSLESVWQVHEKTMAVDEEDRKALVAEREVTMALIAYRSPLAAVSFPRWVNSSTALQAAAPALEISRLLRMLGVGTDILRGLGAVLLATAALGIFIALWSAVRERRADLALLRLLGAPPQRVAALLLAESLWLALAASVLGLALAHALAAVAGMALAGRQALPFSGLEWVAQEAWIPVLAVGVAALAAAIPAYSAYRAEVARLFQSR